MPHRRSASPTRTLSLCCCQTKAWKAGHKSECVATGGKRKSLVLDLDKLPLAALFMLVGENDSALSGNEMRLVRHCVGDASPSEASGQTAMLRIILVEVVTACLLIAWAPFPTQRRRNACNVTELECFLLKRLGALTDNRESWFLQPGILPADVRPFYTPATTDLPASKVVSQCRDAEMLLYVALDCSECKLPFCRQVLSVEELQERDTELEAARFTRFTLCWQSVLHQVLDRLIVLHQVLIRNGAVVRLEGHSSWLEMLRHVLEHWIEA